MGGREGEEGSLGGRREGEGEGEGTSEEKQSFTVTRESLL